MSDLDDIRDRLEEVERRLGADESFQAIATFDDEIVSATLDDELPEEIDIDEWADATADFSETQT